MVSKDLINLVYGFNLADILLSLKMFVFNFFRVDESSGVFIVMIIKLRVKERFN